MKPITVSSLNITIKSILERELMSIYVQGEISSVTYHQRSGHIYFTLKDEKFDSSIKVVMYKGNARYLKFKLEKGICVYITGSINVYPPRGDYQIIAQKVDAIGDGNLHLAYEQLKKELESKGYFNSSIKKSLPSFPKKIIIITSKSGAVIEDIKNVTIKRWANTKLILIDTLVQGEKAKDNIAMNIKKADSMGADLILVARGGGSMEDLWCFNTKEVADAIFNANTPVVSAIGHESDFSLSDYVADKRAATPSSAMEIILPDKGYYMELMVELYNNMDKFIKNIMNRKNKELIHNYNMIKNNSIQVMHQHLEDNINMLYKNISDIISHKIIKNTNEINYLQENIYKYAKNNIFLKYNLSDIKKLMQNIINNKIRESDRNIVLLKQVYKSQNPKLKPKKGFALIKKKNKSIVLSQININDKFTLDDSTAQIMALAIDKS
jgi:exodeoxyribonuclease VII large subunit